MALYRRGDSGVWWMSFTVPGEGRVRESTGTDVYKEAKLIMAKRQGAVTKLQPTDKTWGDAVSAWRAVKPRSESELLSLGRLSALDTTPLSKLTIELFESVIPVSSAGTYMRYRAMVMAILNLAAKRGWITARFVLPTRKTGKKEPRWLTHEEWQRLLKELPAHLRGPATVAINTGLRQTNVFEMRWVNVSFGREAGDRVQAGCRANEVTVPRGTTKSGEGLRIPLNDAASKAIQAEAGKHPEFVFTYRGRPLGSPKKAFALAVERAGVSPFRWHDFRHTWATWHVRAGTPLTALMKLGGWADQRMLAVYVHHTPEDFLGYATRIEK